MALLFQPIQFKSITLKNRIIIAPMCQYSATSDGQLTFWHEQQWANYALSGAGLSIIEATAVNPEGRISDADLGLWNNQQRDRMKELLQKIKTLSPMPFAIQLGHAGRKASVEKPWLGKEQIPAYTDRGWQTVAPSNIPFHAADVAPQQLSLQDIQNIKQDFMNAAQRAVDAGFSLIEIHAAHGYLLHEFLSPLSNTRDDQYGGSLENRMRFTLEVFEAIQSVVPQDYPVGVRISATDWIDEEHSWDITSSVILAQKLEILGAAYIHVSSGGLHEHQAISVQAKYQVPFAQAIKQQLNIPVIAVGLITEVEQAEEILQQYQADAIGLARAILYDPRWPWHAAAKLGCEIEIAPQYLRCQPHGLKSLFKMYER